MYDYRVRANCTGATGTYAQAQFTTTAPATCNAPAGLVSSAVTASSATVSWGAVSGAANYDVDYKLNSSGIWINAATATASTSVGLSGLTASSLYDWRVRANCTAIGLSSDYTQAQFTTAAVVTCPGIYDVSTNGSTSGAALIPFNTDIKGLLSPSGDNDYYRFVITTGGTITMTLTTLPANYQLRLLNSLGSTLQTSNNSGTTNETITRTVTAGTYYARVYPQGSANSATNCYTLKVQLGTATMQELPATEAPKVTVKVFPNPVTDKLTVYLTGDNTRKNLLVYDVNGKIMYSQLVTDMFTILDVKKIPGGVYYLKLTDTDGKLLHSEKFVKQ